MKADMRHFKVSDKLSEVCRHSISALRRTVRLCNKEFIIIVHPTARLGQSLLPRNQIKLPQEIRQCFFGNRQNTIIGFCRCHFRNGLCSRRHLEGHLFYNAKLHFFKVNICCPQSDNLAHAKPIHSGKHNRHFPFRTYHIAHKGLHLLNGVRIRRFRLLAELCYNVAGGVMFNVSVLPGVFH